MCEYGLSELSWKQKYPQDQVVRMVLKCAIHPMIQPMHLWRMDLKTKYFDRTFILSGFYELLVLLVNSLFWKIVPGVINIGLTSFSTVPFYKQRYKLQRQSPVVLSHTANCNANKIPKPKCNDAMGEENEHPLSLVRCYHPQSCRAVTHTGTNLSTLYKLKNQPRYYHGQCCCSSWILSILHFILM